MPASSGSSRETVRIELQPLGEAVDVPRGISLEDALFPFGVEFPCGGQGRCKGCRVRLLEGAIPVSPREANVLSAAEIGAGWRLACRLRAQCDLVLEVAQWEAAILADSTAFEFSPGEGLGVTVDLGTTTVVAQLLDLSTGTVLAVATALNPQARHGSDVMSRVQFAVARGGQSELERSIRSEIGKLVESVIRQADVSASQLCDVVIVGNTVMHHLFCGIDLGPLSHYPFEPVRDGLELFEARELEWDLGGNPRVRFLPCLGSFVGSDILAGIVATGMHSSDALVALMDMGTNGEVVVGNRERLLCASTAAGPAFEGARISSGMRASTGAIAHVRTRDGELECHVLGDGPPRGLCGSGLVDAVAAGIELGVIGPTGRFARGEKSWALLDPISITQGDVRELQLAKGAIAAGLRILLEVWGAGAEDVTRLYLAGAFGNYVDRASARRIRLIPVEEERVVSVGNAALLGAKIALFGKDRGEALLAEVERKTVHVGLSTHPGFQKIFVEEMGF